MILSALSCDLFEGAGQIVQLQIAVDQFSTQQMPHVKHDHVWVFVSVRHNLLKLLEKFVTAFDGLINDDVVQK